MIEIPSALLYTFTNWNVIILFSIFHLQLNEKKNKKKSLNRNVNKSPSSSLM